VSQLPTRNDTTLQLPEEGFTAITQRNINIPLSELSNASTIRQSCKSERNYPNKEASTVQPEQLKRQPKTKISKRPPVETQVMAKTPSLRMLKNEMMMNPNVVPAQHMHPKYIHQRSLLELKINNGLDDAELDFKPLPNHQVSLAKVNRALN